MTYTTYREHMTMEVRVHGVTFDVPQEGQYLTPWVFKSIAVLIQSLGDAGQLMPPTEEVTLTADEVQLICTLLWVAPMRRHVLVITYPTEPDETPVNVNALLAAAPLHAPALRRLHRQQPYADHRHPMTVRATLADVTDDVILMVDENTTFPHMAYFVKKQLHIDPSRIIVVIRINGINVVGVTPAMIHEHDHLEFIEVMSHEDVTLETLMELMNAHE